MKSKNFLRAVAVIGIGGMLAFAAFGIHGFQEGVYLSGTTHLLTAAVIGGGGALIYGAKKEWW